jgi:hypothetical protein
VPAFASNAKTIDEKKASANSAKCPFRTAEANKGNAAACGNCTTRKETEIDPDGKKL